MPAFAGVGNAAAAAEVVVAVAAIVVAGNIAVAGCTLWDLHLYIPGRVVAAAAAREWSIVAQRVR